MRPKTDHPRSSMAKSLSSQGIQLSRAPPYPIPPSGVNRDFAQGNAFPGPDREPLGVGADHGLERAQAAVLLVGVELRAEGLPQRGGVDRARLDRAGDREAR